MISGKVFRIQAAGAASAILFMHALMVGPVHAGLGTRLLSGATKKAVRETGEAGLERAAGRSLSRFNPLEGARTFRANRARTHAVRREATLGYNPPRYAKKKDRARGIENPNHIRNQDELIEMANQEAARLGDQIQGPVIAYYRTSRGRLIRVRSNKGTGNFQEAARLKPGETIKRLESVGFVLENSNRFVHTTLNSSRLSRGLARVSGPLTVGAAGAGSTLLIFGADVLRWVGIRRSADIVNDQIDKEEDREPSIVIDQDGGISFDQDGDGENEIRVENENRSQSVDAESPLGAPDRDSEEPSSEGGSIQIRTGNSEGGEEEGEGHLEITQTEDGIVIEAGD